MGIVRYGIAVGLLIGFGLACGEKQVEIETPSAPSEADLQRMSPMLESQRQLIDAYRNRPEPPSGSGGPVQAPGGAGEPADATESRP